MKKAIFLLLFLAGCLAFITSARAGREQPNVVLIVLDTARADHIGCYGYDKIKTPNIDSIAKKGVLFRNAISQAPLTFPSHCSMFTSTYPQFNKVRDNTGYFLDDSETTLAEILQQNGYTTAAFVSSIVLRSTSGVNQGFQTYDDKLEKEAQKRVIKLMDQERRADKTTEAAVNWLRENKNKKFFLWVHYYDPHFVYDPPNPYKETYRENLYDGEIAFADENIGVLLSTLKELKLDGKTLVVFTSDHGEGLDEHEEAGHCVFIYDTTVKVPLVFSFPGEIPEGKSAEEVVELVDIAPTILDFLKVKKGKDFQGKSLVNSMKEMPKAGSPFAYSESYYAQFHFNWCPLESLRTTEWKYIRSSEPELYNIREDPAELKNLASKKPDIVKDLDRQLEDFLKKTTAHGKKEKRAEVDEETKEKLLSLGYISGSVAPKESGPVPRKMVRVIEKFFEAQQQANNGLVTEAVESFKKVIEMDPNNMEAYVQLAYCYRHLGKYEEALASFKKAASFDSRAETHRGLGIVAKEMGAFETAFKEFEVADKLEPDDAETVNNLGWYYQHTGDYDKAIEYYKRALNLDPDLADTHANLGICYRAKGDLDSAIKEVTAAAKLNPKSAFTQAELCACTALRGQIDEGIKYCRRAIELDPDEVSGYLNLGVCYQMKKEYNKALENFLKAQEKEPRNPRGYCYIGNIYILMGKPDKAKEILRKALEIDPDYATATRLLQSISQ